MPKHSSVFNKKAFLKVAIPSYLAPLLFSGASGYILNKPDLIKASYSTIALPSLLATILSFIVLVQCQKRQVCLYDKFTMTILLCVLIIVMTIPLIYLFQLQDCIWDILPSVIIGTAITALTNPLD